MKISTNQFNITSIYKGLNPTIVSIQDIKGRLIEIYGTSTKIAISQFPDILAMIIPETQLSIITEGRKLIITDSNVSDFVDRPLENFIKSVVAVNEIVKGQFGVNDSIGFNFNLLVDLDSRISDSGNYILNAFIKDKEQLNTKLGGELKSSNLSLVYSQDGIRYEIRIDPITTEDLSGTNKVVINANVHYAESEIKPYADLLNDFKEFHVKMLTTINNLFPEGAPNDTSPTAR